MRLLFYIGVWLIVFILNPDIIPVRHTNELKGLYEKYEKERTRISQLYDYVYKYARRYNNAEDAEELTRHIIEFTDKYELHKFGLSASNVVRQGWQESGLRANCRSKATWHARGSFQITRHYDRLLKIVDNGNLWEYIIKYRIPSSRWNVYYYQNKYNIEMACIIIRDLMKKYNGDYELALIDYLCGCNSKEYRFFKSHRAIFRTTPYYRWAVGIYEL